jgi:allantoinase
MENEIGKDIIIYSRRVILPTTVGEYCLRISGGKIAAIEAGRALLHNFNGEIYDFGDAVIMAGVIDAHVHINEPGRTDWEGFDTGTRAAAAGGVTTIVDMPLNSSPVTTTAAELARKIEATEGQLHINCGFWGGIVPANGDELLGLAEAGVLGFKAFLTHSGIDEFPNADVPTLRRAYETLAGRGLPILAHCELTEGNYSDLLRLQPKSYAAYLASRPKSWENDAVKLMLGLAKTYQYPTHIVHLSSAEALADIVAAKAEGTPITVETCPHYIYFDAETIPDGDTRYKCAPPIRERENNNLLIRALCDGVLDLVGSDHSPATPSIKGLDTGSFADSWGGISGIQFSLPALWTVAAPQGLSLVRLSELLCVAPAKFIGYENRKGRLIVGFDADICVWQPEEEVFISQEIMQAKHKISPYEGKVLKGAVKATFVGGQLVWQNNQLQKADAGEVLLYRNS